LFSKLARTSRKTDNFIIGKKADQAVNPFNKGHKRVKSDIPSNLIKEKLV